MELISPGFERAKCTRVGKCQGKDLWEGELGMEGRFARLQTLIYSLENCVQN